MNLDVSPQLPPQHYEQQVSNWAAFNPGEWQQDLFTIPIEVGLIAAASQFNTIRATPLWPFANETADKEPKNTTYTRTALLPFAIGTSAAVLSGLTLFSENFPLYRHSIGWIHAHLLTELATCTAKVTFQRKRPFYDKKVSEGNKPSQDDRYSFFSGHSSHAFAFATYSSAMMFKYSESAVLNWTFSGLIYTGAGIIAASRITDNAHYVSDVIVGSLVGTLISALVFFRVEDVYAKSKKETKQSLNLNISPLVFRDDLQKSWYGVNIEFNI